MRRFFNLLVASVVADSLLLKGAVAAGCDQRPNLEMDLMLLLPNTAKGKAYLYDLFVYADLVAETDKLRAQLADLRVGLATFNDQPYQYSGANSRYDQYCSRLEADLAAPFDQVIDKAMWAYSDASLNNYYDNDPVAKDVFGAIVQQMYNPEAKWRSKPSKEGHTLVKVVLVVTDGTFRYPRDGLSVNYADPLPENDANADYRCGEEDFFMPLDANRLMKASDIVPVLLVDASAWDAYESLLEVGLLASLISLDDPESLRDRLAAYVLEGIGGRGCEDPNDEVSTAAEAVEPPVEQKPASLVFLADNRAATAAPPHSSTPASSHGTF